MACPVEGSLNQDKLIANCCEPALASLMDADRDGSH